MLVNIDGSLMIWHAVSLAHLSLLQSPGHEDWHNKCCTAGLLDLCPILLPVTALLSPELATPAQDRGEPPGDDAEAYTQVLAGLKLAARHAAEPLLDSLLTWRREALALAAKPKPEVMILRKRVHMSPVSL